MEKLRGEDRMETGAKTGVTGLRAKGTWGPRKLEGARTDPRLEPLQGAWPFPHLDLGLLASRTTRE